MSLFRSSLLRALPGVLAAGLVALPAGADHPAPATPGIPESVEALVAEALEKSPALAAARAEVSAARERVAPAGALPDPMLSLSYENDGASISLGVEPMTRLSLMAEQPIPWPGKLGARAKLAAADAEVVEARLARIRLSVEAAVRRAAARLLEARELRGRDARAGEDLGADRSGRAEPVRRRHGDAAGRPARPGRADAPPPAGAARRGRREDRPRRAPAPPPARARRAGLPRGEPRRHRSRRARGGRGTRSRAEEESPELALVRKVAARETLAIDLAKRDRAPDLVASAGYMNRGSLPLMWAVGLGVSVPVFSSRKQEPRVREAEARLAAAKAAEERRQGPPPREDRGEARPPRPARRGGASRPGIAPRSGPARGRSRPRELRYRLRPVRHRPRGDRNRVLRPPRGPRAPRRLPNGPGRPPRAEPRGRRRDVPFRRPLRPGRDERRRRDVRSDPMNNRKTTLILATLLALLAAPAILLTAGCGKAEGRRSRPRRRRFSARCTRRS